MGAHARVCACGTYVRFHALVLCVCVRERERESDGKRVATARSSVCVYSVCVAVKLPLAMCGVCVAETLWPLCVAGTLLRVHVAVTPWRV